MICCGLTTIKTFIAFYRDIWDEFCSWKWKVACMVFWNVCSWFRWPYLVRIKIVHQEVVALKYTCSQVHLGVRRLPSSSIFSTKNISRFVFISWYRNSNQRLWHWKWPKPFGGKLKIRFFTLRKYSWHWHWPNLIRYATKVVVMIGLGELNKLFKQSYRQYFGFVGVWEGYHAQTHVLNLRMYQELAARARYGWSVSFHTLH